VSVTVKRGALSRIRENPGSIVIQVTEPSDPRLAAEVLEQLRDEIVDIDGGWQSAPNLRPEDRNNPKWVSEVLAVPDGPVVMVDGGFTPVRLLCTIPALVARRLEEAGVSAQVTVPDLRSPLDGLVESSRSVVLRLFGQPSRGTTKRVEVPQGWLREAARWVQDVSAPDGPLLCRVDAAPFTARGQDADALLAQWERGRSAYGRIAAGDPDQTLRLVGTGFRGNDGDNVILNVALGGRQVSDTELLTAHHDLQALARRLADSVAYAFISPEPTFAASGTPWYSGGD